ncbi:MAG: hypothetical protein RR280_09720, partial [Bacteroidaceae bacterium]
ECVSLGVILFVWIYAVFCVPSLRGLLPEAIQWCHPSYISCLDGYYSRTILKKNVLPTFPYGK